MSRILIIMITALNLLYGFKIEQEFNIKTTQIINVT